jgi:hypothetical protein
MSKNYHPGRIPLTFVLKNVVMTAPNICFTGDAITTLSNYPAKKAIVNMDEWNWHKELRGGTSFYIITSRKQADV